MSNVIRRRIFAASRFVVASALALNATAAYAQTGASNGLAGRVTDASGASMAGVTITVTRLETGFERTTTTTATGDWEARFLSPGTYRVSFEHPGFKSLQREGVTVTTGQLAMVDAVMEVGNISEAVAVTGDARMMRRTSSRARFQGPRVSL